MDTNLIAVMPVTGLSLARSAEHVSNGHPDKLADQVADGVIDVVQDISRPFAGSGGPNDPAFQRLGLELLVKDHLFIVSGEARFGPEVRANLDIAQVVRDVWEKVGYKHADMLTVQDLIGKQSPELSVSSDANGAGDQGVMVGYATRETPTFVPAEYEAARKLALRLRTLYESGDAKWMEPDAKTLVSLGPDGEVTKVIIAVQHKSSVGGTSDDRLIQERIKEFLLVEAVEPVLGTVSPSLVTVNGSGSFVIGGPVGDAGVVGRKIVVDAYGPSVPVGGGAFSGKDGTKVDRSAAYMARNIAKTAAAKQIRGAEAVRVSLTYSIGLRQPSTIIAVTERGVDISDWVRDRFPDLSPRAIIDRFDLLRLKDDWRYRDTAAYGHFGRDGFPWEEIADVAD